MVTLAEVARHAGVSAGTVSHVLSGKRPISDPIGSATTERPAGPPDAAVRLPGPGTEAVRCRPSACGTGTGPRDYLPAPPGS
ncbi:LacI family DNA-binding transcriptional regulator [Streptomyces sp. NPDC003327]